MNFKMKSNIEICESNKSRHASHGTACAMLRNKFLFKNFFGGNLSHSHRKNENERNCLIKKVNTYLKCYTYNRNVIYMTRGHSMHIGFAKVIAVGLCSIILHSCATITAVEGVQIRLSSTSVRAKRRRRPILGLVTSVAAATLSGASANNPFAPHGGVSQGQPEVTNTQEFLIPVKAAKSFID